MGEIGGMTVLALKPGDWTVMVRSEATAEPRAASSPLDRLYAADGIRRNRRRLTICNPCCALRWKDSTLIRGA
jgi:hypothetical protein